MGIIRDHAAVTSYATNRCKIVPDDFSGEDFIGQVKEQAALNSCKIILIHNHPSGETEPSNEDIEITKSFETAFGRLFAGHVILDHGTFGLCLPGRNFETVTLPSKSDDPLVKPDAKAYVGIPLSRLTDEKISILKNALQVDGIHSWNDTDWVPVVFANGAGVTQALHYYGTAEFAGTNASRHIMDKTVMIGRQCGAIWAFPVTGNREGPDRPALAAYHDGFIHDMSGGVCPGEFGGPVIMQGLGNARSVGKNNRHPIRVIPGMDAVNL
jgi:proteasome lid subunit RPN8/RPN11